MENRSLWQRFSFLTKLSPGTLECSLFMLCVCYVLNCSVMSNSCNLMDCSPPGSSVHGILQARTLECVAISFSRGSSQARNGTRISCISRWDSLPLNHQGSLEGEVSLTVKNTHSADKPADRWVSLKKGRDHILPPPAFICQGRNHNVDTH